MFLSTRVAYRQLRAFFYWASSLAITVLLEHMTSYIYIWYIRLHFSSMGIVLHNVGGVKCQPFLKRILEMGTKNVFKWNCALWFLFSIQSSSYSTTTVVKVSLFST